MPTICDPDTYLTEALRGDPVDLAAEPRIRRMGRPGADRPVAVLPTGGVVRLDELAFRFALRPPVVARAARRVGIPVRRVFMTDPDGGRRLRQVVEWEHGRALHLAILDHIQPS